MYKCSVLLNLSLIGKIITCTRNNVLLLRKDEALNIYLLYLLCELSIHTADEYSIGIALCHRSTLFFLYFILQFVTLQS